MQRLNPPDPSTYSDEQKRIADSIAGTRGSIRGPFGPWLHAPGLADPAQQFGAFLRYGSKMPGNLRELKNHMQRAVLLSSEGRLTINDLSQCVVSAQFEEAAEEERKATTEWSLSDRVARSEREMLEEALRANNYKRTATAKSLGLSRVGLYKKMRKYGMLDSQRETAGVS